MSTSIPVAVIRAQDGAILVVLADGRVLHVEPGGEVTELEVPRLPQAQAGKANPTMHRVGATASLLSKIFTFHSRTCARHLRRPIDIAQCATLPSEAHSGVEQFGRIRMRSLLRLSLVMVPLMASVAAGPGNASTFTGADLLTQPEASFPSIQPKLEGSSLLFEWGTTHGPPLMHLVRFRVNSAGALPTSGDVTVSAVWDMTRLGCIGFCAAGDSGSTSVDWDPRFYLSDGTTMLGFGLGDGNNGTVTAMSDLDGGANGTDATLHWQESDTNYPAIGDALAIALDFTLHDTGLTAQIRYLGIDRSWTFSETLARTTSLALLLGMDNDSGERYRVNSLQVSVPEPATLTLFTIGLVVFAAARRKKQSLSSE